MITTYSISEAKIKLGQIGSNLNKGDKVSILKNGKPIFFIISADEITEYEQFQQIKKQAEWDSLLEFEEISTDLAQSITESKQEKSIKMTDDEVFNFINS